MSWTIEVDGAVHVGHRLDSGTVWTKTWHCPKCNTNAVRSGAREIESRDTYRADAHCAGCRRPSGVLRCKTDTFFGLEEDEAVLLWGRARVYG